MRKDRLKRELKRTLINLLAVVIIGGTTIFWAKKYVEKGTESLLGAKDLQQEHTQ